MSGAAVVKYAEYWDHMKLELGNLTVSVFTALDEKGGY